MASLLTSWMLCAFLFGFGGREKPPSAVLLSETFSDQSVGGALNTEGPEWTSLNDTEGGLSYRSFNGRYEVFPAASSPIAGIRLQTPVNPRDLLEKTVISFDLRSGQTNSAYQGGLALNSADGRGFVFWAKIDPASGQLSLQLAYTTDHLLTAPAETNGRFLSNVFSMPLSAAQRTAAHSFRIVWTMETGFFEFYINGQRAGDYSADRSAVDAYSEFDRLTLRFMRKVDPAFSNIEILARRGVSLTGEVRTILESFCTEEQISQIDTVLPSAGQYSLGFGAALSQEELAAVQQPANRYVFAPGNSAAGGAGTPNAPWVQALSRFFASNSIAVPATVLLPSGYYEELNLNVPAGIWLAAEEGADVRLVPPDGHGSATYDPATSGASTDFIVVLNRGSGLHRITVDGARAAWISGIEVRGTTLVLSNPIVVHECMVQNLKSGMGIKSFHYNNWGVYVIGNTVRRAGFTGIRAGSYWLVKNNYVIECGVDRLDGGGGDDGILTLGKAVSTRIFNNVSIGRKAPNGRHPAGLQESEHAILKGNLLIADGVLRMGFVGADGTHECVFNGNVVVSTGTSSADSTPRGVAFLGARNEIAGNVILGFGTGITIVPAAIDITGNRIYSNYIEYYTTGIQANATNNYIGTNTLIKK